MKFSSASVTLVLALAATSVAAPASVESGLSKRQTDELNSAIAEINAFAAKRDELMVSHGAVEVSKREYAIVTQILSLINDTNLAPQIIQGLVDNTDIQPILTKTITALIKSGVINLTTLFIALDKSGLAATVIQDIISDCTFYADIYQLALGYISNLAQQIASKLSKREELPVVVTDAVVTKRYDEDGVVNNLLESLAQSGLASSVVRQLIVDPKFLKYGASLIEELFSSGALSIGDIVDALKDSDLVEDLFKQFFTIDTLKTVVVNALAAASGNCGSATTKLTTSKTGTATATLSTATTGTKTSNTSTATATACKKKRKRSYNY